MIQEVQGPENEVQAKHSLDLQSLQVEVDLHPLGEQEAAQVVQDPEFKNEPYSQLSGQIPSLGQVLQPDAQPVVFLSSLKYVFPLYVFRLHRNPVKPLVPDELPMNTVPASIKATLLVEVVLGIRLPLVYNEIIVFPELILLMKAM